MPENKAAWLMASQKTPLEVLPAPYTSPGENEIVIKTSAVAINPVDWVKQTTGALVFPSVTYPTVQGMDTAGTVVEVGVGVSRFKPGDRVLGHALSMRNNNPAEGAFQGYTVLQSHMVSVIPDSVAFEQAAVLPLALSTAASGLFMPDYLALELPALSRKPTGQTVLIWGGATSVGCNAIQLAVAAGYEVVTTASAKNFDLVKRLGAAVALDYHSERVEEELVEALQGKTLAGALAITRDSVPPCARVVERCHGRRFIASGLPYDGELPKGVETKFIFASNFVTSAASGAIYGDFLPKALAAGKYTPAPEPEVVGKGLEYIQAGYDRQKQGMSARKVVVII